ncbi:transmembrane protein 64-like [Olea europaea var. sylvestris]|uniref:transmembrane protein 64-like n=1 Tax=Olea europaea var. sylvestris TaxID=158386 RepID=UPI000C1D4A56|nr:transmembrane protein 64-like [Olea europaea var. sylvestris]
MIYDAAEEDFGVGDYVKLEEGSDGGTYRKVVAEGSTSGCCGGNGGGGGGWLWSLWWWAKLVLVVAFLVLLGAVFFKWVGPFFMDKEIIPIIIWERETFSKSMLALLVFSSIALFPTLLLPSTPSMWVAGMTFGYGYGFLLIIGAVAIGVSLPYLIGFLFHHKIQVLLEKYSKQASIIKLAGEGNWFDQLRDVTLIRISPFPYVVYNYCAVATDVNYCPYLLGTLVGMVPEIFVAIYTGILIETLADASNDRRSLSAAQIICNVIGFCISLVTTVIVTLCAKRRLKKLQAEEERLLR